MGDYQWELGRARSIYRKTSCIDNIEQLSGRRFQIAAICEDWSVITESLKSIVRCFLWNSVSNQTIELPSLKKNCCLFKCVLSSPPTKPDCIVIFLLRDCRSFISCRVGDRKFTPLRFTFFDLIGFDSKLYGLLDNGRLCVIKVGPHLLQLFGTGIWVGVRSINWLKKLQLVESCGDLLVVRRKSLFSFEVFKVDLVRRRVTKLLDLGDRVLVLSHCYSVSLSATELGIHGNCIYFFDGDDDDNTFYVFHLGDKTLSTSRNQPEMASSTFWFSRHALLPFLRFADNSTENEEIITKEESNLEVPEQETLKEDSIVQVDVSILFNLPMDLQLYTLTSLFKPLDYMNFRAVCRKWKSLAGPIRWRPDPTFSTSNASPWLMYFSRDQAVYKFYDPIHDSTYHMKNTDLYGCEIRFSNNGWLLVSQSFQSMFLFEPFTKTRIQLPKLPDWSLGYYCFDGVSFEASQTCSEWVVFGIYYRSAVSVRAFYVKSGDENWTHQVLQNGNQQFIPSYSNPVFYGQGFYCLGQNGRLGIFEFSEGGHSWVITGMCRSSKFFSTTFRSFLVRVGEELFSVFLTHAGKSIRIFKLVDGDWVEVNGLENQMLFVSQISTLAIRTTEETMKNTLFFPTLSNSKKNVFYSFKNRRFRTINRDYASEDLYDTKEILCGTWIKPLGNFVIGLVGT